MREQLIEKLGPLLKNTECQTKQEKEHWIELLPQMTDNQIQTLVDILEEEKRKLEEVDRRNQSLINQLGKN